MQYWSRGLKTRIWYDYTISFNCRLWILQLGNPNTISTPWSRRWAAATSGRLSSSPPMLTPTAMSSRYFLPHPENQTWKQIEIVQGANAERNKTDAAAQSLLRGSICLVLRQGKVCLHRDGIRWEWGPWEVSREKEAGEQTFEWVAGDWVVHPTAARFEVHPREENSASRFEAWQHFHF